MRRRLLDGLIPAMNVGGPARPVYRVREADLTDYEQRSRLKPADTPCV